MIGYDEYHGRVVLSSVPSVSTASRCMCLLAKAVCPILSHHSSDAVQTKTACCKDHDQLCVRFGSYKYRTLSSN